MRVLLPLLMLIACGTPEEATEAPSPVAAPAMDVKSQLQALDEARKAGQHEQALRLAEEGLANTDDRRARQRFARAASELEVIGRKVGDPGVSDWFVEGYDPEAKAQLWVFWEVWCPHCRREMPQLQALHEGRSDLEIVGLTRLSKDTTPEKAEAFITDKGLTYPIGRTNQSVAEALNVQGVPAAALIVDGEVRWRGHPGALDEAGLTALLN